jgi:hypothetical protein
MASRISLVGGEDGVYTLYQFTRDLSFSSGRRAGGVSAEEMREVGTIYIPAGGDQDGRDLPFAVKPISSYSDGTPERYGIYLPPTIIEISGEHPSPAVGLAPASGDWWYELPNGAGGGAVYLHVTRPYRDEQTGARHVAEAEIVSEAGEWGEHDIYIEIADVRGGAVTQKVVGTLVLADDEKGVTSLNDLTGDLEITGGDRIDVEVDGKTISISYNENKGGGDDSGDGYCNDISGEADLDDGNAISDDFGLGAGGGGGQGTDHENAISETPCNSEE